MRILSRQTRDIHKVFLLFIYTAYFAVNVCLRFSFPHTDVGYSFIIECINEKRPPEKHIAAAIYPEGDDTYKNNKTGWLSKYYTPWMPEMLVPAEEQALLHYIRVANQYALYQRAAANTLCGLLPLRGPPATGSFTG